MSSKPGRSGMRRRPSEPASCGHHLRPLSRPAGSPGLNETAPMAAMRYDPRFYRAIALIGLLPACDTALVRPAGAQVVLDGSLGPAGELSGPNIEVPAAAGRQVGRNLFHSFSEFNVLDGETATFTAPAAAN